MLFEAGHLRDGHCRTRGRCRPVTVSKIFRLAVPSRAIIEQMPVKSNHAAASGTDLTFGALLPGGNSAETLSSDGYHLFEF